MNGRNAFPWLLAAGLALVLPACGGDDASTADTAGIGEEARSEGIVLTVHDAYVDDSVSYTGGVESAETPDAKPRTVRAPRGGRYVLVETTVLNDTGMPIDMTCSVPVYAKVVGDSGRRFEPISGLRQIEGNPPCNQLLQPGSETDMTWVFAVPRDATISAFEFADHSKLLTASPSDPVTAPEPTAVRLPELGGHDR